MKLPNEVNADNFKLNKIIYQTEDFSIAYGFAKADKIQTIAMRWNGEKDKKSDIGYPSSGNKALWFFVSKEFTDIILKGLLTLESHPSHHNEIIEILSKRKQL